MTSILALFLLFALPAVSLGFLNPPQFISLMPPGAHEVLERENQIENLCPKNKPSFAKCRADVLKPQSWALPVYKEKYETSQRLGMIVITATPGKGVAAVFTDTGKKAVPFKSDSDQTDWGYSSYFEFSLNDIQGDWLQLPKRPFPTPVWINLKIAWKALDKPDALFPAPTAIEVDRIYAAGKLGNIVITKFDKQSFTFRKENKNDMLCGDEPTQVSPQELKMQTRPISELYDGDGHLIAWIAYARGC